MCSHRIADAIADYRQAHVMASDDGTALREALLADIPHLRARGICDQDTWLVVDAAVQVQGPLTLNT